MSATSYNVRFHIRNPAERGRRHTPDPSASASIRRRGAQSAGCLFLLCLKLCLSRTKRVDLLEICSLTNVYLSIFSQSTLHKHGLNGWEIVRDPSERIAVDSGLRCGNNEPEDSASRVLMASIETTAEVQWLSCTSEQYFVSCSKVVLLLVSGMLSVIIIRRLGISCATGMLLTCPLFVEQPANGRR